MHLISLKLINPIRCSSSLKALLRNVEFQYLARLALFLGALICLPALHADNTTTCKSSACSSCLTIYNIDLFFCGTFGDGQACVADVTARLNQCMTRAAALPLAPPPPSPPPAKNPVASCGGGPIAEVKSLGARRPMRAT